MDRKKAADLAYAEGYRLGADSRNHEVAELERERDTAWAQAHRLALELECLIMDTKDNAVVSKWWDSAFEAIEEYQALKPGADEESTDDIGLCADAADRIEELEGANMLNRNALRLQKEKCDALQADNAELVAALERMRVAGGSQEFHIAWELAKDVLTKVRKP